MTKSKGVFKYAGFAVFLLICLILITIYHTNDTMSKYSSMISGDSSARTAKWDVSIEPVTASNVINMVTGSASQDYTIKVKSRSEVSSSYSIIVSNVPNDVRVSIDDGTEQTPSNNTVTFSNVGTINVGDSSNEKQHKLTFRAPLASNAVTNNQVSIQVSFTQID